VNIRSLTSSTSFTPLLLALVAGAVTPLAFAPFQAWPLQIATLALLFWLVARQSSVRRAGVLGWLYGFGWFTAGVHWLYISMHDYGGMPSWMAALAVALLAMWLGLFAALAMGATTWVSARWKLTPAPTLLLVAPSLWALGEWARGWALTGFSWLAGGYAHTNGPLAGYAPLIGVYGIVLVAALIAGCVALLPQRKWPLALGALLVVGGSALQRVEWTSPQGKPITVRLLQGNVPQDLKFAPEQLEATLALYHRMITSAPADLIATPETAIPLLSRQLPPDYLGLLGTFLQQSHSSLVLGIPVSGGPGNYANSVLGLSSARIDYRYDKHHLVPFGEFIPWGFRWFVDMMNIPLGDFTPGTTIQAPFAVRGQLILPNICYEDLFGEEIAAQLAHAARPATILLNVSNIAWFGDSIALPQHLQISQMRSLETGRPMLRATNTGATAIINPAGRVVAQLQPFERGVLQGSVQGYAGLTPYTRIGNYGVIIIAGLLLAGAWLLARRRGNKGAWPE
jgi:apolipoprotein N-acyltransferase